MQGDRCPECGRPFDPADRRSTLPTRHADLRHTLRDAASALLAGLGFLLAVLALPALWRLLVEAF